MSIADYEPVRERVSLGKATHFEVRGLSLEDIATLMRHHGMDLEGMIEIYANGVNDDSAIAKMAQYALSLAKEAPLFVAAVIALGADEPDQVQKIRAMNMAVQVDALKKIGKLTFEEAGGPKKFFESLRGLLSMVAPSMMKTDSLT